MLTSYQLTRYFLVLCILVRSHHCALYGNSLAGNFIENLTEDYRHIDADLRDVHGRFDAFARSAPRVKRSAKQDSSSYVLNGFVENGTVPVNFPRDICLFEIQDVMYAAALHLTVTATFENKTLLTIFQKQKSNDEFQAIYSNETRAATCMDCTGMGVYGYIALVNTIENSTTNVAGEGSPIFQIHQQQRNGEVKAVVRVVQYFTEPHQNRVYLRKYGDNLFLLQSFVNAMQSGDDRVVATNPNCQIYKWSGYNFDVLDELPCSNAMRIEPFLIGSDIFIAIANYMDANDDIETFSFIYKFSVEHSEYVLTQKLRTYAAVDVKYFYLQENGELEHFLVVANSHERRRRNTENGTETAENFEMNSIIYKFANGYFTPFQSILLYDVIQFLPVLTTRKEFILLISCNNQDTKVWQYNGWTFYESEVQFTGGALGKGVSNMRRYPFIGSNVLVVANSNMLSEATNIYLPVFSIQQDSKYVRSGTDGRSWCTDSMAHVQSQNLDSLSSELAATPKITDSKINLEHDLTFQQLNVRQTVNTKSLKTKTITLNQQMADQLNAAHTIVQNLNRRLDILDKKKLKQNNASITTKFAQLPADIAIAVPALESASQIVTPALNETHAPPQPYDHLNVHQLTVDFINGHPIDRLVHTDRDLHVKSLTAQQLQVNSSQTYKHLKAKATAAVSVTASSHPKSIEYAPVTETITLETLIVDGTINQLDWATLHAYALKTEATEQRLQGRFNFERLHAHGLTATKNTVSGRRLSALIRTDAGGPYNVSQDARFDETLYVDRLHVDERINNLRVLKDGRFDALLKNASETQTIGGQKSLAAVKLLNPIVLQGKISSARLSSMNPIVAVQQDIELDGDFEITGTVTIRGQMHAQNMLGPSGTFNVVQLHTEGLPRNTSIVDANIEFVQPIKTKQLLVFGTINSVDVASFVCGNGNGDIQLITGAKTFAGDLHVNNGFCDAIAINGIEMKVLNDSVLKRSGDQEIHGNIHFKQIIVNKSSSRLTMLAGRSYSNYLTRTDQIVSGAVHVTGDLIIRDAVQVRNLVTSGHVCGHNLQHIVEDTVQHGVALTQPVQGDQLFGGNGTITFEHVQVHGRLFAVGRWEEILAALKSIENDIELSGPLRFDNRIRLHQLIVEGQLNAMPAESFGRQWLVSASDQDFTEPQEVATLQANEMVLNANLNDVRLKSVYENSVWLNETLRLQRAVFDQLILDQPISISGTVGGIRFPEDILLAASSSSQQINGQFMVDHNVTIAGNLVLSGLLNGIDYNKLCDLIATKSSYGLHVLGPASFASEPHVDTLNGENVQGISEAAWFVNENTRISGNLSFKHAEFDSNVRLKGPMNGKDLLYISENYFSLSRPQDVHVRLNFENNVMFEAEVEANEIRLDGFVQDNQSDRSFKIEDLQAHALTRDTSQFITGQWTFYEATISGNLVTHVNDLDLSTDVLRYSVPINEVSAPKYFQNVVVAHDLTGAGTVQGINIPEWVATAAFVDGNYTIQGTTVVEHPIFYNNLKVFGHVNNVTFNADTILLKSINQTIRGNLYVLTKYQADNKILPLSFEQTQLVSINGLAMQEFFANLAHSDEAWLKITSNLTFVERLSIGNLITSGHWNGISLPTAIAQLQSVQHASNYTGHFDRLQAVGRSLITNLQNRKRQLVSYRLRQTLPGQIQRIVQLQYVIDEKPRIVYAIFSRPNALGVVNFYKWDPIASVMTIDNDHFALRPKDMYIVDIMALSVNHHHDYLIIETADPMSTAGVLSKWTFFTFFDNKFRNVHERYNNGTHHIAVSVVGRGNSASCYASFAAMESRVLIKCTGNDPAAMLFDTKEEFVTSEPVVQVVATAKANELIVLGTEGTIQVWQKDLDVTTARFEHNQSIRLIHAARYVTAIRYARTSYLVASTHHILNSTHFGSLEVYKYVNGQYEHMQSIPTDVPVQCELATDAITQELVLYVLTGTTVRPFAAYKFVGVAGFRQFFVATTLAAGRSFAILHQQSTNTTEDKLTLISVLAKDGHGAYIIEPVMD